MSARTLTAWWDDGTRVGEFVEGDDRRVQFTYSAGYAGIPLSASLPVREVSPALTASGEFVARNFLENLLPENPAARNRIARQHDLDPNDTFGLLGAIGRECAGALILMPAGEPPATGHTAYDALSGEAFDRWYEFRESVPLMMDDHGRARLSLAGAQPKAVLYFDENGQAFLPLDGSPSSHIVKPPIRRAQPNTVYIEWYCMALAADVLGAPAVAEVDLWKHCLRVRRFDRLRTQQGISRLHQEDLCQALGLAWGRKYESLGRGGENPSETLLARAAGLIDSLGRAGLIHAPAVEKQALFQRVAVNALLGNADAHLKNYGLLYDVENRLHVAPMYDVVCTLPIRLREGGETGWDMEPARELSLDRDLALNIGQARYVDEISDDDWMLCGTRQFGLTARYARKELSLLRDRLRSALTPVADRILETTPQAEPAISATRDCLKRAPLQA